MGKVSVQEDILNYLNKKSIVFGKKRKKNGARSIFLFYAHWKHQKSPSLNRDPSSEMDLVRLTPLHKKLSFPLRISSVYVTKSAEN